MGSKHTNQAVHAALEKPLQTLHDEGNDADTLDLPNVGGYDIHGLTRCNLVLGRNGCGKSRLLKTIEGELRKKDDMGTVRYLSPERGGELLYDAGVDNQITSNQNWLGDSRRKNQAAQFRQQSAAQYRRLELRFLRELENSQALRSNETIRFDSILTKMNALLTRIEIRRGDATFIIIDRSTEEEVKPQDLSSGESELISIAIECLSFEQECDPRKSNFLLIDEPDVHLHPDMQARLAQFILKLTSSKKFRVIVATHSTALLSAMNTQENTRVAFMRYRDQEITFQAIGAALRSVIPIFGAHPLSQVFTDSPILLLEGEDDARIWQQVVRSGKGKIKLYPCDVNGLSGFAEFEKEVAKILLSVYDEPIGYSLRDKDSIDEEINDFHPLIRMRLACRSAENLILTDEVLEELSLDWDTFEAKVEHWLKTNCDHPHFESMKEFKDSNLDRVNANLKEIRNDIMGLMGSNKPWEVLVGRAIASITTKTGGHGGPNSLKEFLGEKVCTKLLNREDNTAGSSQ